MLCNGDVCIRIGRGSGSEEIREFKDDNKNTLRDVAFYHVGGILLKRLVTQRWIEGVAAQHVLAVAERRDERHQAHQLQS